MTSDPMASHAPTARSASTDAADHERADGAADARHDAEPDSPEAFVAQGDLFGMPVLEHSSRARRLGREEAETAVEDEPDGAGADAARHAASKTASKAASDAPSHADPSSPEGTRRRRSGVMAVPALPSDLALAADLSPHIRIGTSSWSYPGWQGEVWVGEHSESVLSRQGLTAYAQHPLLRAVSIDRGFYQSLTASQYERYAQLVPKDFRFVVKAPSAVTDALVRAEDGRGRQANEAYLDARLARSSFVEPALEGLGEKAGALVFQLSPLPLDLLARMPEQLDRLWHLLRALPRPADRPSGALVAVEVRDPEWLCPDLAALLKDTGACYCLGLHPKLPPIEEQLPLLRAMWPGPLVARWNLHRRHGPYGYEDAQRIYGRYDQMMDPDPDTRGVLARVMRATAAAGHEVLVTVSNHAEGAAPLSVRALVEEIVRGR